MACCGGKGAVEGDGGRRFFPVELLRLAVNAVFSALFLFLVHLAALVSAEARRQAPALREAVAGDLSRSFSDVLDTPFLVDGRHRCRLSGRLYPVSETLAGGLYRYFNLLVFGALVAGLSSVALLAGAI